MANENTTFNSTEYLSEDYINAVKKLNPNAKIGLKLTFAVVTLDPDSNSEIDTPELAVQETLTADTGVTVGDFKINDMDEYLRSFAPMEETATTLKNRVFADVLVNASAGMANALSTSSEEAQTDSKKSKKKKQ